MELHYLISSIRPSKQYKLNEVRAYPNIKNFTSTVDNVENIKEFYASLLKQQAAGNSVLLKGLLDKPLDNESRAGAVGAMTHTQWFVLDIDGLGDDLDAILKKLGLDKFSHIVQFSSSYGIKLHDQPIKPGLRAHVFFRMDRSVRPSYLKDWFKQLCLQHFTDEMQLTPSGHSLTWPLDPSVAENSKLIYIAPAVCEAPYVDALSPKQRITLVNRDAEFVPATVTRPATPHQAAVNKNNAEKLILKRRGDVGLSKSRPKLKAYNSGLQVLLNPEKVPMEYSHDDRGFAYYNMNAGDSLAYYHPSDNPTIIYSFKPEEHPFRFQDVDPIGYEAAMIRAQEYKFENKQAMRGVGRNLETDKFFSYLYEPEHETVQLWTIARGNIDDHLANHNMSTPDPIPDFTTVFDPTVDRVFDPFNRWINTHSDTIFGRSYRHNPSLDIEYGAIDTEASKVAPNIMALMDHVLGNDHEVLRWGINWLGYIMQVREKPGTALVVHGVPGSGKNVFFENVIKPLVGSDYYSERRMDALIDKFDSWSANQRFILINEANEIAMTNEGSRIGERLKNMITEDNMSIRAMNVDSVNTKTYYAVALASNSTVPLVLDSADRRFTIAVRQERKLYDVFTDISHFNFIETIKSELHAFAQYLYSIPVNDRMAHQSLMNDARMEMVEGGKTSTQEFCDAVKAGRLDYFISHIPLEALQMTYSTNILTIANSAKILLTNFLKNVGEEIPVANDELRLLYSLVTGNFQSNSIRFGRMLGKHNIHTAESLRRDQRRFRGVRMRWHLEDMTVDEAMHILQSAWAESSTLYTEEEVPDFLKKLN